MHPLQIEARHHQVQAFFGTVSQLHFWVLSKFDRVSLRLMAQGLPEQVNDR